MSIFNQFDPKKQPKFKVELHIHLDGAVRLSTIWDLAQKKGIDLKCQTLEDLIAKCQIQKPSTLVAFLAPFQLIIPVIFGDLAAIERISYEFCQDISDQGILYSEVRYCPHLFCIKSDNTPAPGTTPRCVMKSIVAGLARGQRDFQVTVRSILCCFRGRPEWSREILDLCREFQSDGVVAIDIVGDEASMMASAEDIAIFQEAYRLGIHRTAHAAEAGPASNVAVAVKQMMAERIGHGYHVLEDNSLYEECLSRGIHFETCPYSSYLTGSVSITTPKHPIIQFAEDNANFSISRDDPFIIQKSLADDYDLLKSLGLTDVHISRANFNAARSCFLPTDEKKELISCLKSAYGAYGIRN